MKAKKTMIQEVRVPIFLSGIVVKLEGVDHCMDGATCALKSIHGLDRLKPSNDETKKFLTKVAGKRLRVAIAGYREMGPECTYISVYYAAPVEDVVKALSIKF